MNIAVVGAGPAGLIAAVLLADRGESVTLIDEHAEVGGHLSYDQYQTGSGQLPSSDWLAELQTALDKSPVACLNSAIAWAAFRTEAGIELAVNRTGSEQTVVVDRLVIAAGTTDLPLIAPGATLPGVMTSRAVRILVNRHKVIPGRRAVIVGGGARAERMRADLVHAGCDVVAVLAPEELRMIGGEDGVQSVLDAAGVTRPADIVVVACGEAPDVQLAGMLETPRRYDPALGGWRVASAEEHAGVDVVGGALLGPTSPSELIQSVVAVADRIHPAPRGLGECGLLMSSRILQAEAVA